VRALRIVDTVAFAAGPGGGNPCPVVLGVAGWGADRMQALAAELGHETGFVLPPSGGDADVRLRYFVPRHEMEMCVHATVASLTVLAHEGRIGGSPVRVQTPLGVLACGREGGRVRVPQFLPDTAGRNPPPEDVAAVLRIAPQDVDTPPTSVSCSRPKLLVPLRATDVLDALQPDLERLWDLGDRWRTTGAYPFVRTGPGRVEARQFPVRAGYPEDPATGTAAAALGCYLAARDASGGRHRLVVTQGRAMGRPSELEVTVTVAGGGVSAVEVGGRAEILGQREPVSRRTCVL
jgi:trans-2,3-dihydro-3-hydroxyanthranilate isomerase